MFVTLRKIDNKLIESQSHGNADAMLKNARAHGWKDEEIIVKEVDNVEYEDVLASEEARVKANKAAVEFAKQIDVQAKKDAILNAKDDVEFRQAIISAIF